MDVTCTRKEFRGKKECQESLPAQSSTASGNINVFTDKVGAVLFTENCFTRIVLTWLSYTASRLNSFTDKNFRFTVTQRWKTVVFQLGISLTHLMCFYLLLLFSHTLQNILKAERFKITTISKCHVRLSSN